MRQTICASLFLLLTSFSFTSCQKEYSAGDSPKSGGNNNSTYYIKGKKDGVAFTYSANAMAMITDFSSSGGAYHWPLWPMPNPMPPAWKE
jgi:hypothetical protein